MEDADRGRLKAIRERLEGLTPGPWKPGLEERHGDEFESVVTTGGDDIYLNGATKADQDFIAHARQDIPWLVEWMMQASVDGVAEVGSYVSASTPRGNLDSVGKIARVFESSFLRGVALGILTVLLLDFMIVAMFGGHRVSATDSLLLRFGEILEEQKSVHITSRHHGDVPVRRIDGANNANYQKAYDAEMKRQHDTEGGSQPAPALDGPDTDDGILGFTPVVVPKSGPQFPIPAQQQPVPSGVQAPPKPLQPAQPQRP